MFQRLLFALLLGFQAILHAKSASFKTGHNFETDLREIRNALNSLNMTVNMIGKSDCPENAFESFALSSNKNFAAIDDKLSKLYEKSQIWGTYQHYITAWIDQMTSMERKLDILNKGQEHLLTMEAKLNNIIDQTSENDYGVEKINAKLQQILDYLAQIESSTRNNRQQRDNFLDLVGDFTTRGILTTVKRIESKIDAKSECKEALDDSSIINDTIYDDTTKSVDVPPNENNNFLCNKSLTNEALVNCVTINGTQWTIIAQRGVFTKGKRVNFNQTWENYRVGFGSIDGEFWAGNDYLNSVTHLHSNSSEVKLRIEVEDFKGHTAWAEYDDFKVASEDENYALTIGAYRGNATDSFGTHNGASFSTYDENHDEAPECCPCAISYGSGWWFNVCFDVNLNGIYHEVPTDNDYYGGIIWDGWLGNYSLRKARMMITSRTS